MEIKINGTVCTDLTQVANAVNEMNNSYDPGNGQLIFHNYRKLVGTLVRDLIKAEEKIKDLDHSNQHLNLATNNLIAQRNEAKNAMETAQAQMEDAQADSFSYKVQNTSLLNELNEAQGQISRQSGMISDRNKDIFTLRSMTRGLQLELAEVYKELSYEKELVKQLKAQIQRLSEPTETIAAAPGSKPIPERDFIEGATGYFLDGRSVGIKKHINLPHYLVKITNPKDETKFVLTGEALAVLRKVADHVCTYHN